MLQGTAQRQAWVVPRGREAGALATGGRAERTSAIRVLQARTTVAWSDLFFRCSNYLERTWREFFERRIVKIKYAILRASRPSRAVLARGRDSSAQRLLAACFCFSSHVLLCTATSECMAAARSACSIAS